MAELDTETSLIDRASRGDEDAFRGLVEPLDRELHVFCYRMLGSFHDAEDALQEVLVKAWRRQDSLDGRASFRSGTYKIASNTCLDMLRARKRRVLPQDVAKPYDTEDMRPSEWGEPALEISSRFVRTFEEGDIEALVAILTTDAELTMAPMRAWFKGVEAVRASLYVAWEGNPRPGVFRVLPARLNGQPAFAGPMRVQPDGPFEALDIAVLTLDKAGTRVRDVTAFVRPDLFRLCGLPERLE